MKLIFKLKLESYYRWFCIFKLQVKLNNFFTYKYLYQLFIFSYLLTFCVQLHNNIEIIILELNLQNCFQLFFAFVHNKIITILIFNILYKYVLLKFLLNLNFCQHIMFLNIKLLSICFIFVDIFLAQIIIVIINFILYIIFCCLAFVLTFIFLIYSFIYKIYSLFFSHKKILQTI